MKVRLGAVGYLNARPHVFGLDRSPRFELRFDVPSRCADLLHEGTVDVGLIPSIEYYRGAYRIVPDVAIASLGPVASVALFTTRPMADVRSIAMDASSRTSVALAQVLCARAFKVRPALEPGDSDLESTLARCDAALVIGDKALFTAPGTIGLSSDGSPKGRGAAGEAPPGAGALPHRTARPVEKIDLGEVWTRMTGLPFVYAFWAGRPGALTSRDVGALQEARDAGAMHPDEIARAYCSDPERQTIGARYLRDNIRYRLGPDERAGLELFYRYAEEAGVVPEVPGLRFF